MGQKMHFPASYDGSPQQIPLWQFPFVNEAKPVAIAKYYGHSVKVIHFHYYFQKIVFSKTTSFILMANHWHE